MGALSKDFSIVTFQLQFGGKNYQLFTISEFWIMFVKSFYNSSSPLFKQGELGVSLIIQYTVLGNKINNKYSPNMDFYFVTHLAKPKPKLSLALYSYKTKIKKYNHRGLALRLFFKLLFLAIFFVIHYNTYHFCCKQY